MFLDLERVHLSQSQTRNESSIETKASAAVKLNRSFITQVGAEPPDLLL